jgi:hypothetical protein
LTKSLENISFIEYNSRFAIHRRRGCFLLFPEWIRNMIRYNFSYIFRKSNEFL